jgi:hypothetical protein
MPTEPFLVPSIMRQSDDRCISEIHLHTPEGTHLIYCQPATSPQTAAHRMARFTRHLAAAVRNVPEVEHDR